jgi:hypothetical protein
MTDFDTYIMIDDINNIIKIINTETNILICLIYPYSNYCYLNKTITRNKNLKLYYNYYKNLYENLYTNFMIIYL